MKLTFLDDCRVMFVTWDKKISFKTYFRGNHLENVGITEDLIDANTITVAYNKSSFTINKNLVKIE